MSKHPSREAPEPDGIMALREADITRLACSLCVNIHKHTIDVYLLVADNELS